MKALHKLDLICESLFEKSQQQISISLVALLVSKVVTSLQRLALQLVSTNSKKKSDKEVINWQKKMPFLYLKTYFGTQGQLICYKANVLNGWSSQ